MKNIIKSVDADSPLRGRVLPGWELLSVNGKLTGSMLVQHFAGFVAHDEEVETDRFFELGIKLSQEFHLYKHYTLELNGGVKILLDQFQRDLDRGKDRDAAYVYGPALPRTWFIGLNLKL